ncbi:uncharacterized protein EV422DRAFT_502629 [Fimicolochytrium jonesii]|uniref:uncharacterized protein n=1 Tax=Fimicolochytrium jonesii TaxID=1396493 RepID=UPI0022FF41F3|nr:uncharacterized protein EV422DRAFT_502629 [Fimicolochytrium jonesii]KAI8826899.1 hypothetical protein EV422DRAFT_502629 [Fimicolochytrium jonesii]
MPLTEKDVQVCAGVILVDNGDSALENCKAGVNPFPVEVWLEVLKQRPPLGPAMAAALPFTIAELQAAMRTTGPLYAAQVQALAQAKSQAGFRPTGHVDSTDHYASPTSTRPPRAMGGIETPLSGLLPMLLTPRISELQQYATNHGPRPSHAGLALPPTPASTPGREGATESQKAEGKGWGHNEIYGATSAVFRHLPDSPWALEFSQRRHQNISPLGWQPNDVKWDIFWEYAKKIDKGIWVQPHCSVWGDREAFQYAFIHMEIRDAILHDKKSLRTKKIPEAFEIMHYNNIQSDPVKSAAMGPPIESDSDGETADFTNMMQGIIPAVGRSRAGAIYEKGKGGLPEDETETSEALRLAFPNIPLYVPARSPSPPDDAFPKLAHLVPACLSSPPDDAFLIPSPPTLEEVRRKIAEENARPFERLPVDQCLSMFLKEQTGYYDKTDKDLRFYKKGREGALQFLQDLMDVGNGARCVDDGGAHAVAMAYQNWLCFPGMGFARGHFPNEVSLAVIDLAQQRISEAYARCPNTVEQRSVPATSSGTVQDTQSVFGGFAGSAGMRHTYGTRLQTKRRVTQPSLPADASKYVKTPESYDLILPTPKPNELLAREPSSGAPAVPSTRDKTRFPFYHTRDAEDLFSGSIAESTAKDLSDEGRCMQCLPGQDPWSYQDLYNHFCDRLNGLNKDRDVDMTVNITHSELVTLPNGRIKNSVADAVWAWCAGVKNATFKSSFNFVGEDGVDAGFHIGGGLTKEAFQIAIKTFTVESDPHWEGAQCFLPVSGIPAANLDFRGFGRLLAHSALHGNVFPETLSPILINVLCHPENEMSCRFISPKMISRFNRSLGWVVKVLTDYRMDDMAIDSGPALTPAQKTAKVEEEVTTLCQHFGYPIEAESDKPVAFAQDLTKHVLYTCCRPATHQNKEGIASVGDFVSGTPCAVLFHLFNWRLDVDQLFQKIVYLPPIVDRRKEEKTELVKGWFRMALTAPRRGMSLRDLLFFWTSSRALPLKDRIVVDIAQHEGDHLPSSRTCSDTLELHLGFGDADHLADRLWYAVWLCRDGGFQIP